MVLSVFIFKRGGKDKLATRIINTDAGRVTRLAEVEMLSSLLL